MENLNKKVMTHTTKIIQQLQLTNALYQEMLFNLYIDWCAENSTGNVQCQNMLIFQPLFKWWQTEFKNFELNFLDQVSNYSNAQPKDKMKLYLNNVEKIFNVYSKTLIQAANGKTNYRIETKRNQYSLN